jgi:hypothetical protein
VTKSAATTSTADSGDVRLNVQASIFGPVRAISFHHGKKTGISLSVEQVTQLGPEPRHETDPGCEKCVSNRTAKSRRSITWLRG